MSFYEEVECLYIVNWWAWIYVSKGQANLNHLCWPNWFSWWKKIKFQNSFSLLLNMTSNSYFDLFFISYFGEINKLWIPTINTKFNRIFPLCNDALQGKMDSTSVRKNKIFRWKLFLSHPSKKYKKTKL